MSSEFGNDGSSSKVSLLFQVTCEESTSKEDFLLTILPGEEEKKNSY